MSHPPSVRAIPLVRAGTGRILVVDDDWVQLRTAARVLSHYGYEVTTAATSAEAHRAHEAATAKDGNPRFDLVVVDMILHEADDGLALFARLQRLGLATKGIIVSGNAPTGRLSHAISKGLRFLAKPYRADELIASIQAALDCSSWCPIQATRPGRDILKDCSR
jgi:CheY-like chemotaxis protein